jgi:hypothetical protein
VRRESNRFIGQVVCVLIYVCRPSLDFSTVTHRQLNYHANNSPALQLHQTTHAHTKPDNDNLGKFFYEQLPLVFFLFFLGGGGNGSHLQSRARSLASSYTLSTLLLNNIFKGT